MQANNLVLSPNTSKSSFMSKFTIENLHRLVYIVGVATFIASLIWCVWSIAKVSCGTETTESFKDTKKQRLQINEKLKSVRQV
jgi:hypothetical protein